MDFCPSCGSRLFPKTFEKNSQALLVLSCKKCGYRANADFQKLDFKRIQHSPKQEVAVIDNQVDLNVEPTIQVECSHCGNNTSYVWQVQTRGADESSTQFLKCTKCGYTVRETT